MASFTAAGTSYATHGEITIPFYSFYSMFGFQRTGDQIWAFGDARGRGFLMAATAGRTTLNGEGLQHEDGHSHILATTVPVVRAYDPAFAYETAMIIRDGLFRMYEKQEDIFYYITLYNENIQHPAMPEGVEPGIVKGLYRFRPAPEERKHQVQLFGSGSIMRTVLQAQALLLEKFDVAADVWSATSYQQLRNEALSVDRWNRFHPEAEPRNPYVAEICRMAGPIIAATAQGKRFARFDPSLGGSRFISLGTDGCRRSDNREGLEAL
jgi:pyruvate dehydrogenase E1 component